MSKSNKMFADKAFELVKELERSSQTIPPFDVSKNQMKSNNSIMLIVDHQLIFFNSLKGRRR